MIRISFTLLAILFVISCTAQIDKSTAPLVLKPASYSDLPGWQQDNHQDILQAFSKSCHRILKRNASDQFGPDGVGGVYGDWRLVCQKIVDGTVTDARSFFEKYFTPYQATMAGMEEEGLFTGYYEASLRGSQTRSGSYQYPLYKRPDDLVMVDLGAFREELRGQRIAGRVVGARLKPYEDRAAIEAGNWPHHDEVLVWVDDPVDAFFLHIQGSGRVVMDDGSQMRVGYAGQNGHVYYAIGRELIKRGHLEKEKVSMQSIRLWLEKNPGQAEEIMNTNRSYVFFKELKKEGPLGGEGVALTAGRSLAIDRSRLPYGVPLWVDIDPPRDDMKQIRRLMMAQDTGGAIRGAVRGDVYWGYGDRAEEMAGIMKSQGRYWLLLPNKL